MASLLTRVFTRHVAGQVHAKGWFDIRGGIQLFRDRNVPVGPKVLAIGAGIGITLLMVAFEAPIEGLLAFLVPMLGLGVDLAFDGMELVVLPLVIAAILLPRMLPKNRIMPVR